MSSDATEVEFEYMGIEELEEIPRRNVTVVRFHSSVTEMDDYMFVECKQLKKVVLNDGLQKIENHSFYACKKLEHIHFPSTLVEVGSYAFAHCGSLREVVINEGLQKTGIDSFSHCRKLQSIRLPSTITEIGRGAFCGCHSLREVVLNEGLQTIGQMAFGHCSSLERIAIPSTVRVISENTFWNCTRLREIELHEGIQKIGSNAFERCTSLERFTFPKLSTRLETITLAGQTEVEEKVDNIRGYLNVERRSSELFSSAANRAWTNEWKFVRAVIGRIERLLTYYEVREATTLLELAMWKAKMEEEETANRDVYRIGIPGPVKDTILQLLNFRV
jgi:hypothetical protein